MKHRNKSQMNMFVKLDELIRKNPHCKKLFRLARDIVKASFEEKEVVENMEKNLGMIHQNASGALNFLTKEYAKTMKFACRAGCSFCCHMRVAVSSLEIFVMARFIRNNFDKFAIESLKVKLRENLDKTMTATETNYASLKIPCALLDSEGKCSIYQARPFSCRRWVSYDVKACEAAFTTPSGIGDVPLEATVFVIGVGIEDGLLSQFEARGLDENYYELHSGLLHALENEDAAGRWCRGEEVFRDCLLAN